MDRVILHIDINNCYASIEQKLNPELRGKAIAVCGNQEDRRGIILAKSEEAKKYGVKTGEVIWQAKQKCPQLMAVSPHHDEYIKHSKMAQNLYYEYTNLVEPFGIDECWLDVTDSVKLFGSGENIAKEILKRMREEIGLTVSIGVSFNKIFAKLGSDMKKPDAMTVINRVDFKEKIWSLDAQELLTIGRHSTKKLRNFGVKTIGDVARIDPEFLKSILGKNGYDMWRYANGLDNSKVSDALYAHKNKSISNGFTCRKNLKTREDLRKAYSLLAQKISRRLVQDNIKCFCVQISLKDEYLQTRQFQTTLQVPISSSISLIDVAMQLIEENHNFDKNIRAVNLRTTKLVDADENCQLDLFNVYMKNDKREKIDKAILKLEDKYTKGTVKLCSSIKHEDITSNREQLTMLPIMAK